MTLTMRATIAVTGGIGSGKSSFCEALSELGAAHISADESAHAALQVGTTAYAAVAATFADCVGDAGIDRALLASRVFESPEARRMLEQIVHPWVREDIRQKIAMSPANVVVVEIPLLAETRTRSDAREEFTYVVTVWAPLKVRQLRAVSSGLTEPDFRGRVAAQADDVDRFAVADLVIPNTRDVGALRHHAVALMARVSAESGRSSR